MSLRIIFMGTPDFAVPTLTELVAQGHDVVGVYTQPPRPAGRGKAPRKTPVHVAAESFGIRVFTPKNFKDEVDRNAFAALDADVGIVVAYGLLLPQPILDAPKYGCLNLHGSLLPRWRGAAPIQRAIMAGDTETGVMVMQMDEGLDTGPIGLVEHIPVSPEMTAGELHDEMMRVGADLMVRALVALERGSLEFTAQRENGVVYAKKIDKGEARVNWSLPSPQLHNIIRGLSPFPGAWFEVELQGKPVRVKILKAQLVSATGTPGTILDDKLTIACGDGALRLQKVQREGKSAMDAEQFLRGTGDLTGQVLV